MKKNGAPEELYAAANACIHDIKPEALMDPILALAIATFAMVVAFLMWNRISTKKHQEGDTTGVGGLNDPMSGTTKGMRDPDEMRAALDAMHKRN